MQPHTCEIGMVGLGVMGRNLLLNMADHGYAVAGYDLDGGKVAALQTEAGTRDIQGAKMVTDFVALLRSPRVVMLLVPAGKAVDAVMRDLLPHLAPGDLIIDAGNSNFSDTDLRQKTLATQGIHFFGMGVSGGEDGARHGPSMMPGGPPEVYERVRPLLEATAAHVHGEPCVAYLGPGSAGHYVKMVHNGIEYALMELIAESYDLLHRGCGFTESELAAVYAVWNQGELNSFLLEITADIFQKTGCADEQAAH
ncbi:MAG: NAD(P)-binding domain-containing protein [Caldilineaceae bacterium]